MIKALIVDDERPARQAIMALGDWQKHGIEKPLEAGDGPSALQIISENKPDIVFVDISMPRMDGLSLMEEVSRNDPETLFIVISGFDDFEYARRSIRYNVIEYLLKPVIEAELDNAISRAVDALQKRGGQEPSNDAPNDTPRVQKDAMVADIKRFIDERYMENISLQQFASRYFVTKEHLSRCFKKELGFGIYEYVTHVRMERAKALLKNPELKINAVSRLLGYSDHNYFSRVFYRYFGVYPTQYRSEL